MILYTCLKLIIMVADHVTCKLVSLGQFDIDRLILILVKVEIELADSAFLIPHPQGWREVASIKTSSTSSDTPSFDGPSSSLEDVPRTNSGTSGSSPSFIRCRTPQPSDPTISSRQGSPLRLPPTTAIRRWSSPASSPGGQNVSWPPSIYLGASPLPPWWAVSSPSSPTNGPSIFRGNVSTPAAPSRW